MVCLHGASASVAYTPNPASRCSPTHPTPQPCFVVHDCLHDPPQKFVACGSEDRHVYLWDLNTKQVGEGGWNGVRCDT